MESQEKTTAREAESQLSAADLARAVVALPGLTLLPGLRLRRGSEHYRLMSRAGPRGGTWVAFVEGDGGELIRLLSPSYLRTCTLDLADPATGGALLSAMGPDCWCVYRRSDGAYEVSKPDGEWQREGATLGEACARVVLALGCWPGGGAR